MDIGAALGRAAVAFLVSLLVLFLISAILPGVNISIIYWSIVIGVIVFLLSLLTGRY